MVGLGAGFLSAPVADWFFCEYLGPEFFPSFGAVYRVTAHVVEHRARSRSSDTDAQAEGHRSVVVVFHVRVGWFVSPTI